MLYTADLNNIVNVLTYISNTQKLICEAEAELNNTESEFKPEIIKILESMYERLDDLSKALQNVSTCVDDSGIVT